MQDHDEIVFPIAKHVIQKCGGVNVIVEITGQDQATIHKWKYPKSKGGRGGLVPVEAQQQLMEAAREGRICITPEDFFDIPDQDGDENASTGT